MSNDLSPHFSWLKAHGLPLEATDILDLGCGPGQPALLIAKTLKNARVHATDVQDGAGVDNHCWMVMDDYWMVMDDYCMVMDDDWMVMDDDWMVMDDYCMVTDVILWLFLKWWRLCMKWGQAQTLEILALLKHVNPSIRYPVPSTYISWTSVHL